MLKRILSVILVVLMILSLTSITLFAKNDDQKNYPQPSYGNGKGKGNDNKNGNNKNDWDNDWNDDWGDYWDYDWYNNPYYIWNIGWNYGWDYGSICNKGCSSTHIKGCNLYQPPNIITCNKGCYGTHNKGCNLYQPPNIITCNKGCSSTHIKGCNLYQYNWTCNKGCYDTHIIGCDFYQYYNVVTCNKGCYGTHLKNCNLYQDNCDWNCELGYYWHYNWDCTQKQTCINCLTPAYSLKYPVIIGGKVEGYVINFDSKNGSKIISQGYSHGQLSVEPEAPVRDGYKFGGWYVDENCKIKEYEFDTRVTYSFTLYAKWTPVKN